MALALGTRRSTIAAVTSTLAAMALAAAVAGRSCHVTEQGPEATVRDLYQAAQAGDRDTIFELLGPATRARLEQEATLATDLVREEKRYRAQDLISIGASEGTLPSDITLIEAHGGHAIVEVVSAAGRARVELVQVDGHWRVELPQYRPPGS